MRPLRVTARWVLPVGADPIADGAVLVGSDGRIAAVGRDAATPRPFGCRRIALGDAALLPGLVNTHSHLELTALRGLVRDLPFFEWIQSVRTIKDGLDAAAFRASARWGVLESFAAGITTSGDTGSTLQVAGALAELGGRGVAYQEVVGPDPATCAGAVAGLERAVGAMAAHASDRVEIGVSPHAPYTVSEPLLRAVAALAADRRWKTAMHVAESAEERELVEAGRGPFADHLRSRGIAVQPRGSSAVSWLAGAGYLACRPLLIHGVTAGPADLDAVARAGAAVAHCPWSNAMLGHGRADVATMRRLGIAVGLGTDSVAAGGRLDLFAEARYAAVGQALSPRELLRLVTADGARALRLDGVGTLAAGAWGDLTGVGLSAPALASAAGPEAAVAWGATAADVVFTAVAGRPVYRRGRWPGVEMAAERSAFERAAESAARVSRAAPRRDIFGR